MATVSEEVEREKETTDPGLLSRFLVYFIHPYARAYIYKIKSPTRNGAAMIWVICRGAQRYFTKVTEIGQNGPRQKALRIIGV